MAFEYGEEIDSSGNITHTGSWGAKSIPKDAMARIIEDLRLVYDEPTTGTTTALALKANTTDVTTALALKAPIDSPTFTGTVTAPTFVGSLTGNAATSNDIISGVDNVTAFPSSNFRTTIFGSSAGGTHVKPFRTNDYIGQSYNSGLAWGVNDTQGFIQVERGDGRAFIGGGAADIISWQKEIAFTNSNITGSAATLSAALSITLGGTGLTVGAAPTGYGLGTKGTPKTSVDLNTITLCGFYSIVTATANYPGGYTYGYLTVISGDSGCTQEFSPWTTNYLYKRYYYNGTWYSWQQVTLN